MHVAGAIGDVIANAGVAESLLQRAGAIEGLADELAGIIRGAADASTSGSGDTLVQRMASAARASDELIMRAESELDEVRRGAAQLGGDGPGAVALDPVRGMTLIPDAFTFEMREALTSAILDAVPDHAVRADLFPDAFIRPGMPLDSIRYAGQPIALIVTPETNWLGKQVGMTARALADNYPVGEMRGYSTSSDAVEAGKQIAASHDGIVLVRKSYQDGKFFLHFTKDSLGGSQRAKGEYVQFRGKQGLQEGIFPDGHIGNMQFTDKFATAENVPLPVELAKLEAIVAGAHAAPVGGSVADDVIDVVDHAALLPERIEVAAAAVDGMRAERTALRDHRMQAATIEQALDRAPGSGDRYAWETKPLFGSHTQPLLATDLVASSPDPNVAIGALTSQPDGTYVVMANAAGSFETYPVANATSGLLDGPAHGDMRAIVRVHDGGIMHVQGVSESGRTNVLGSSSPSIAGLRLWTSKHGDLFNDLVAIPDLAEAPTTSEQTDAALAWLRARDESHTILIGRHVESNRPVAAELYFGGKPSDANLEYDGWKTFLLEPFKLEHGITDVTIATRRKGHEVASFKP